MPTPFIPTFAAAVLAHAEPAVAAHKRRRSFCAPEVMEFPDEYCMDWADELILSAEPAMNDLVRFGTAEDIQVVLAFFSDTAKTWPAHRRAFFNRLHTYATRMELEGRGEVSEAFAYFMRERYMPSTFYAVERRAAPHMFPPEEEASSYPVGLPLGALKPIQEESSQEAQETDESFSK